MHPARVACRREIPATVVDTPWIWDRGEPTARDIDGRGRLVRHLVPAQVRSEPGAVRSYTGPGADQSPRRTGAWPQTTHDRVGDMMGRSRRTALVVVALFALAVPMQAQDATSSVSFDGVGFDFSHTLGRSVNILRSPRQGTDELPLGEGAPAHIVFSLYPRQSEAKRVPALWDLPGSVNVYRTRALEGYAVATRQWTELQRILTDRPEPQVLEADAVDGSAPLPYLPVAEEAAQALVARVGYIDTPELSGVAYVTGFRQGEYPFTRDDLWYSFQGLSTDGRWYVAVNWRLRAGMFPRTVSQADAERVGSSARRWERYIRESVATLDAAEPTAFLPSLDTLDALVRSIDFASVVPPSPSPALAPSASASPGATEGVASSTAL